MRIVVVFLLALAAHFNLTSLAPAEPGKASIIWPFAADSAPLLAFLGRPQDGLTAILSLVAGLCFLAAAFGLLTGRVVPRDWLAPLASVAVAASVVLYLGYFTPRSLVPLLLDAILLWGMMSQGWAALRGA